MAQTTRACPKVLALLETFYRPGEENAPWETEVVVGDRMPRPYRDLLVHDRDTTSTLAGYHRDEISLRVLDRVASPEHLARHIVLQCGSARRPVEYGASRIRLDSLDDPSRRKVLEGRVPLGGILNTHEVEYGNCPRAYFAVRSNGLIGSLFELKEPRWLYGRCNCLSDPLGNVIAEVVEILPP